MRHLNHAASVVTAVAGALMIPAAASACPGCMVGDPRTAGTYLGMTIVMSSLPILLVCGLAYYLWRRYQ